MGPHRSRLWHSRMGDVGAVTQRPFTKDELKLHRGAVSRRHGRPMMCPQCGGDVFIDGPHICPPGFVKPAREVLTFYGYKALNQCCRSNWLLLGWPQEQGRPKREDEGIMRIQCPQCQGDMWFNLACPDLETYWDQSLRGKPDPPTLLAGEIKGEGQGG